MIEHPVPQNITEYQFHLIGNMTVKQFLILLVGVVVAFVFYSTNLPAILKWPLIIVVVGGVIALAFVPYEERTLDQWLVNFVRAIYRPTKFYWRRTAPKPEYFAFTSSAAARQVSSTQSAFRPERNRQVSAYLSSIQTQSAPQKIADPLDLFQDENDGVSALFDSVEAASNVTPGKEMEVEKPDLQVRARPLGSKRGLVFATSSESTATKQAALAGAPDSSVNTRSSTNQFQGADPYHAPVFTMEATQPEPKKSAKVTPNKPTGDAKTVEVEKVQVKPTTTTDTTESVDQKADTKKTSQTPPKTPTQPELPSTYTDKTTKVQSGTAPIPVVFNKELPFPSLPEKPNLLLGMVHDKEKNIIPGAIVEILDKNGNTVRAMKTNNLGQFYISTPLKKGQYVIETEAQDHSFPVYTLEVNDSVLDPVDIQALA